MAHPNPETKREKELREKLYQRFCNFPHILATPCEVVGIVMDLLKAEGIIGEPPPSLTIARDELRRGGQ